MSELKELCKTLIGLFEKQEESDSGTMFYPNQIVSCRCMDSEKIGNVLDRIKEICEKGVDNE